MRAATAEVRLQRLPDVGIRGVGLCLEQRLRPHHHAGDAIAALRRLLLDEGFLHRPWIVDRAQALHGPDLATLDEHGRRQAGEDGLAVDHHGTSAALAEAAAEFGAVEFQIVAQHIEQRRRRIDVDVVRGAVDVELNHQSLAPMFSGARSMPSEGRTLTWYFPLLVSASLACASAQAGLAA